MDLSKPPRPRPPHTYPGRAIRLTADQLARLVAGYKAGVTVYELAADFGIDRRTVSAHMKRQGVQMRLRPPNASTIDEMVRLYRSGLSLAKVGGAVGFNADTVLKYLRTRGVPTRDTQGRSRADSGGQDLS